LPVDVAVSPDQQWVAVAHAGPADFEAPRPFIEFPDDDDAHGSSAGGPVGIGGGTLTIHSTANLQPGPTCAFPEGMPTQDTVTAVAFTANGKLVAQVQEPPRLLVIDNVLFGPIATIELPGTPRADTGHDLFHRDSGGGIACASCHPEGGEDGRTWRFSDTGERRTQPLNIGLEGTAPFHWAGDLPDVGSLMSEVFVQRMGGVRQSPERLAALTKWLFALEPLPAVRDALDEQAVRGKELFNSPEVGCATCHSGDKLTNNATVAIDSLVPAKTQVPSLVGIGYRAPFMHTGCAATLVDRFDPACGGNAHGNTAQLSPAELGELVAYLESL
ncbi:MAG TPA: cytochrome-c peroxidase, partial [Polyangiaceae bacterium]|nr:cytochrome-c peroxidase [Polyangiaceae bacterium]